jgi:hypothetical protein
VSLWHDRRKTVSLWHDRRKTVSLWHDRHKAGSLARRAAAAGTRGQGLYRWGKHARTLPLRATGWCAGAMSLRATGSLALVPWSFRFPSAHAARMPGCSARCSVPAGGAVRGPSWQGTGRRSCRPLCASALARTRVCSARVCPCTALLCSTRGCSTECAPPACARVLLYRVYSAPPSAGALPRVLRPRNTRVLCPRVPAYCSRVRLTRIEAPTHTRVQRVLLDPYTTRPVYNCFTRPV